MAEYKSFSQFAKRIERDINSAKLAAVNRSLTSTRAEYAKVVSADLGLPSKTVKARSRIQKPTRSNLFGALEIGIKYLLSASLFKPKSFNVMSRIGKRKGASYTLKGVKTIAQGGFVIKGTISGKNVIVKRTTDARKPITTVQVDAFIPAVKQAKPGLLRHMLDTFKKNFASEIKFRRSK